MTDVTDLKVMVARVEERQIAGVSATERQFKDMNDKLDKLSSRSVVDGIEVRVTKLEAAQATQNQKVQDNQTWLYRTVIGGIVLAVVNIVMLFVRP